MEKIRARKLAAVLGAVAVLTAGCQNGVGSPTLASPGPSATPSAPVDNGVAALTAEVIAQRAKAAIQHATSFHMKGDIDQGQAMSMDFEISGKDVAGSISKGKATARLLSVGGQQYARLNEQFWTVATGKQARTIAEIVGDRWVKVPAGKNSMSNLFRITSLDELFDPNGKLSKGPIKQIGGVPAIAVTDTGENGGTMYVATTGEPYPLQFDGDGTLVTFSEFGKTFADIKKPTDSEVFDMSALRGK